MTKTLCIICLLFATVASAEPARKYNIVMISIDDLNDWVGCMGGNPQAKTPHMDRLHAEGGMVMNKAYCPASVCCPSRSALLTGLKPSTTGVYGNGNNLKRAPKAKEVVNLTEYFSKHGYHTASCGKIYHKHATADGVDEGQWAYDEWEKSKGSNSKITATRPYNKLPMLDGSKPKGKAAAFDWLGTPGPKEQTKDYRTGLWAANRIKKGFNKPFFMAVGISKPHMAWYVPREYFDMHPLDKLKMPEIREDDLDDIKTPSGRNKHKPHVNYLRAKKHGKLKEAVQAYMAACSYADACVGVVLDALRTSKYKDNTIVMIWGDHGWYLTEKMQFGKTKLWEEAARVPFIVKVPGMTQPKSKCERVVNLLDIYPTLIELCGLPANPLNEGRSFAPLLAQPGKPWPYPTLTTMGFKNHAIRDERFRYIRWSDGTEELYDHDKDPMGFANLAAKPEHKPIIERLKQHVPKHDEPESPKNEHEKKPGKKSAKTKKRPGKKNR